MESSTHALPPAFTVDAQGKPLHSWRTLILPYLDQRQLYESIDLSKPWNDPVNARAYETSVSAFRCNLSNCPKNHTTYLAVVTPNSCLRPIEPRPFSEITDRRDQTLVAIEVSSPQSVPWMAPRDADEQLVLGFGPNSKLPHPDGTHAALLDGSVRFLSATLSDDNRRALISISGGEVLFESDF